MEDHEDLLNEEANKDFAKLEQEICDLLLRSGLNGTFEKIGESDL